MPVNLIIIIIFFVLLLIIAVFFRNSTLDRLILEEGESVLFEEKDVRVEQAGAPSSVMFINCIVRVTSSRIIIAQKMLFRDRYALRHVIEYGGNRGETDLKSTFKSGYIIMRVDKAAIKVTGDGGEATVSIAIPDTALIRGQYITFRTGCAEKYRNL